MLLNLSDLFTPAGRKAINEAGLDAPFHARALSLLRLIDAFDFEIDVVTKRVTTSLKRVPGYTAIQAIPGVGPVLAAVFVAEIGDVHRFPSPRQLCSWAGMTPRHRESDTKVHRGRITKQGNHLVRWAAVEAVQRVRYGPIAAVKARLAAKWSNSIAKVAAARELLTLVYYGLRDGHIRALAKAALAATT
jgi:transposase